MEIRAGRETCRCILMERTGRNMAGGNLPLRA
jgi:hypothetical protein